MADLGKGQATVRRAPEIQAADDQVVCIGRVDPDRVVIGTLTTQEIAGIKCVITGFLSF